VAVLSKNEERRVDVSGEGGGMTSKLLRGELSKLGDMTEVVVIVEHGMPRLFRVVVTRDGD
jgi:hypothetical protein